LEGARWLERGIQRQGAKAQRRNLFGGPVMSDESVQPKDVPSPLPADDQGSRRKEAAIFWFCLTPGVIAAVIAIFILVLPKNYRIAIEDSELLMWWTALGAYLFSLFWTLSLRHKITKRPFTQRMMVLKGILIAAFIPLILMGIAKILGACANWVDSWSW
jgi:hypothetical protein